MYSKKLFFIIIVLFNTLICTSCSEINSEVLNPNLSVNSLDLRISLFQTSYDIFLLNNKEINTDNLEDFDKDYVIWLKNINSSLSVDMKNRLNNIFMSNSYWQYINSLMLNKSMNSVDSIMYNLTNNSSLLLDESLKEDLSIFLEYFYDNYLYELINKEILFYDKKSTNFNKIMNKELVDIHNYIESTSGISISKKLNFVFYFTFSDSYNTFINNNTVICTINKSTDVKDLLNVIFHQYSHLVFEELHKSKDINWNHIYNELKNNKEIFSSYNDSYKNTFTFNDWCDENLIEGFTKYLDYLYCKYDYDFSNYIYDLDFYMYLRKVDFSSKKDDLSMIVSEYYKSKQEKD